MTQSLPRRKRYHSARPPVTPAVAAAVDRAMAAVSPVRPDKALALLQQLQAILGHLPADALHEASRRSGIPLADLNALVSFYDLLTTDPDGTVVIHVCNDLVCRHTPGARALAERLAASGQKVRMASCLGQCDRGPAALVTRAEPAGEGETPLAYGGYRSWSLEVQHDTVRGWPVGYRPLLLARCGQYDPAKLDAYRAQGGLKALTQARAMAPAEIIALLKGTRLIGRGGAAFPTGIKWEGVLNAPTPLGPGPDGALKYVVVNGDESEPGTFTNRVLMEEDPLAVIEAALIAAHTVGAGQIYIFIRGEYPRAIERITGAISSMTAANLLNGVAVEVRVGGGKYVCGEETALFGAIEGLRGTPRVKPPFPTTNGLFDRPTLINNVETLINLLPILTEGADAWNQVEPKLFSISGHVASPGVYELPLGTPLAELIALAGGPTEPVQAVLMGGASGMFLGPDKLNTPLAFKAMAAAGATLGSGAVMVFGASVDLWDVAGRAARFFAEESCGKCVPCRIGTARQEELVAALAEGDTRWAGLFAELSAAMTDSSICGLGQTATSLMKSLLALKEVQ
ncbi:MAG: NADH-ubiquinone oxidoreductase-F iron-sulfur binding region domain-containing protein [Mycobacterium leprae]